MSVDKFPHTVIAMVAGIDKADRGDPYFVGDDLPGVVDIFLGLLVGVFGDSVVESMVSYLMPACDSFFPTRQPFFNRSRNNIESCFYMKAVKKCCTAFNLAITPIIKA